MVDAPDVASRHTRAAGPAHGRPNARRLLASGAMIALVCTAFACNASGGTPSEWATSAPTTPGAVSIPTGNLDAYAQCMIANGWRLVAIRSAGPGAGGPGYEWTRDNDGKSPDEIKALLAECDGLRPSSRPLTNAEIREIYDRWVDEYHCMVGLGYQPDPPPSFEAFLATWKTGPWMPIDGVDVDHWTQGQYDEAKAKCTLEFFDAEGLQT